MYDERDEALLMGQTAGIIAALGALVVALPPTTRKRLSKQLNGQFESLFSAMRGTGATDAKAERQGAEWVRDLFLSQIEKGNNKSKNRKASGATDDAVDIQL